MASESFIRDITDSPESEKLPAHELAALADLTPDSPLCISDTETTGLNRDRNGLTEIASIRAMRKTHGSAPRLELFHSFILPFRPEYQDYLEDCAHAKDAGLPLPPYSRSRYEYEIEPQALAVTGTEILRDRLDGPITGLKVNGKPVAGVPFYAAMDAYLHFTSNGSNEAFYNAPFDAPFLGKLIADVRSYNLARANAHHGHEVQPYATLDADAQHLIHEYADHDYASLTPQQRSNLVKALRPLADIPDPYRNPAHYRCLMYNFLTQFGFGPRSTLDDAIRLTGVDSEHGGRGDHSGIEDVLLAARVALKLIDPETSQIRKIHALYGEMLRRVDPHGSVHEAPQRLNKRGEIVEGDIQLSFSQAPSMLSKKAQHFWGFIEAFDEVTKRNNRVPHHLLHIDTNNHHAVVNVERKNPLILSFLKKSIAQQQAMDSKALTTITPYDSTGKVDVTLQAIDPATGLPRIIEDIPFGALNANRTFLEAHHEYAENYLTLMAQLYKSDPRVGMVLFRDREDGKSQAVIRGHQRAFGECILPLPHGEELTRAQCEALRESLQVQLKLGAIPNVQQFIPDSEIEEQRDTLRVEDELAADSKRILHTEQPQFVSELLGTSSNTMQMTMSPLMFACIAYRLGNTPDGLIKKGGVDTLHGRINIRHPRNGTGEHYILNGQLEAFHDVVEVDHGSQHHPRDAISPDGEKPTTLIQDASWLLHRLQRIPGTYGITIKDNMAILDQRAGVDLEALGLLFRVGIPFKAYDRSIKVDIHQLMENAFHWSKELDRAQSERKQERDDDVAPENARFAPPRFLRDVRNHLWHGDAKALEVNEKRQCWILDSSRAMHGQPQHHLLEQHGDGIRLNFANKRLIVEESDIQGPQRLRLTPLMHGGVSVRATPLVLYIATHRLAQRGVDSTSFADPLHPTIWRIPEVHRTLATHTLREASRFVYWLSKATGSERQSIQHMALHAEDGAIICAIPSLAFLARPALFKQMLDVHRDLSDISVDMWIRSLQPGYRRQPSSSSDSGLPDPYYADRRRDDLLKMVETVRHKSEVMVQLTRRLEDYNKHLGGKGHERNPSSINLTNLLRDDLSTLGLLRHELSSADHALGSPSAHSAQWLASIHLAQTQLGNVAFGAIQLRDDIENARKTIAGTGQQSIGLMGRTAQSMAMAIGEYAEYILRTGPDSDLDIAMQPYHEALAGLVGNDAKDEILQPHAQIAAMRHLLRMATAGTKRPEDAKIADYLLTIGYPEYKPKQRKALLRLYSDGATETGIADINRLFPHFKGVDAKDHWLIRQHQLLTVSAGKPESREAWEAYHPEILEAVEKEIASAYRKRGKHYLRMARIKAEGDLSSDQLLSGYCLGLARECFERSDWSHHKIEKEIRATEQKINRFRNGDMSARLSSATVAETHEHIALHTAGNAGSKEDLLKTINLPDQEAHAREHILAKAYKRYCSDIDAMHAERIIAPYAGLKQRRALIGDIKKTLKESLDLLKAKPHHVRHIQHALSLLQQDSNLTQSFANEAAIRPQEIGEKINTTPDHVGITDSTLADIHGAIAAQHAYIRDNFLGLLGQHGIEPAATADQSVTIRAQDMVHLFDLWRGEKIRTKTRKESAPKEIPHHLHPWLTRAAERLFTCPVVTAVALTKSATDVTCQIELPLEETKRTRAWAQLQLATTGLGLRLPDMPPQETTSIDMVIPLTQRVVRQEQGFDAETTPRQTARALRHFAMSEGAATSHAQHMVEKSMRHARNTRALENALARIPTSDAQEHVRRILEEETKKLQERKR